MKRAFTLVELVLTLVIGAILAGFATFTLNALSANFAISRELVGTKQVATNAALVLQKRLDLRIKPTLAAFEPNLFAFEKTAFVAPSKCTGCTGLAWFVKSYETQRNQGMLGWSGYADAASANATTTKVLVPETLGDLSTATTTLADLTGTKSYQLALIFDYGDAQVSQFYNPNSTNAHKAQLKPPNIEVAKNGKFALWQTYTLSHTINAVFLRGDTLFLAYDFLPWSANEAKEAVLATNVSKFSFKLVGDFGVVFTLCVREGKGESCKSAASF